MSEFIRFCELGGFAHGALMPRQCDNVLKCTVAMRWGGTPPQLLLLVWGGVPGCKPDKATTTYKWGGVPPPMLESGTDNNKGGVPGVRLQSRMNNWGGVPGGIQQQRQFTGISAQLAA